LRVTLQRVDLHTLNPAQRRVLVGVVLLGALLVLGVPRLLHRSSARVAVPVLRAPRPAQAASSRAKIVVDVAGAVRRPGLHALAPGTRIADALAAAGGATKHADVNAVNLAAPVADGEQIVVPARGTGTAGGSGGATPSPTAPLDLNTASLEQLDALPGIGPTTAQKILDYRQAHGSFHSVDELDAVPGIGQGRLAQLKGLVLP
jgi:competence protein ComEA